jgi:TonB-dependent SusC/RagA subfamily outer membrane receptor
MKIYLYNSWLRAGLLLACLVPGVTMSQELASLHSSGISITTQTNVKRPLKQVLREMEAKYHIFFTYKDIVLQDKMVEMENGEWVQEGATGKQLENLIASLLATQQLGYKKIDNIYVVFPKEERLNIIEIKQPSQKAIEGEASTAGLENSYQVALLKRLEQKMSYSMHVREVIVRGQVTDEGGNGLPGVNVLVKGTNTGTSTDAGGNFSISVPDNNAVLVFSFIGYVPEEIAVALPPMINVKLIPDIKSLSEVVVVGYGTQERKDVTGAVGSVDTKQLESIPIVNAGQALQGRVAGVNITANSGVPGAGVKVDIRGIGTVNNSDPLYVVDGFYPANINTINANDIVSIDILKDASASAIYGVLGANGVVIITTKRAKAGKPTITYDGQYGFQKANQVSASFRQPGLCYRK